MTFRGCSTIELLARDEILLGLPDAGHFSDTTTIMLLETSICNIVGAVKAINELFRANSSKATKFGPDVDITSLDRFWVDAKKDISLRHRGG